MRKYLVTFLVFTIFLSCLTACYAQSAPKIDKTLSVKGLNENVIVRRDSRSIPYIEAKNEADLYFAQGFETARDRLWQMDLLRRVARGQLAELFGKQVLEEDKRWRRYGFSEIAEESLKTLNPELKTALENYARGVNAYISTLNEKTLPIEFQLLQYQPSDWKVTDTIVIGKILAEGLSTTWWQDVNRAEWQKVLSKEKFASLTNKVTKYDVVLYGKDSPKALGKTASIDLNFNLDEFIANEQKIRKSSLERIGFYAEDLAASNNWVISGKRTADGKAILANDPHLPPTAPGIWYLTHLSTPEMQVSGVTFPGVPGIVLGHNQYIAWGATNVGPDVQDVYLEEFNDNGEYKTPNGWQKANVRKEILKVRANPMKPDLSEEVLEVVETRNGVVFNNVGDRKLSLNWTARNPVNQEFEAFILLNKAKNWNDFRNALKNYGGATQNFVYADVEGNIGWQVGGKVPMRRVGEGDLPYNGAMNDGDWVGTIPFEEMPNLYNPPNGFIVTANQRIVGTNYKYQQMTRQYAAPWRAKRIYDLINANKKITMNDVSDIQHDVFNIPLSGFTREIVKRQAASEQTINLLKGWDGKMTADSIAATLATKINECVGNEISDDSKAQVGWFVRQNVLIDAIPNNDKLWLPKKFENWDALLKSCDLKATESLKKDKLFGENSASWKWGIYNSADFMHPLAIVPFIGGQFKASYTNVDGSGQTPNVGDSVSMRHIAKPANWDETRHVIPLGQSGDPQSVHWKDQFESWRTGKSEIFPFTKEAVEKSAKETVLMTP